MAGEIALTSTNANIIHPGQDNSSQPYGCIEDVIGMMDVPKFFVARPCKKVNFLVRSVLDLIPILVVVSQVG